MEQLNIRKPDKASFELVAIRILVIVPEKLQETAQEVIAEFCI